MDAESLHQALSCICCTAAELLHGMAWHGIATDVTLLPRLSDAQWSLVGLRPIAMDFRWD